MRKCRTTYIPGGTQGFLRERKRRMQQRTDGTVQTSGINRRLRQTDVLVRQTEDLFGSNGSDRRSRLLARACARLRLLYVLLLSVTSSLDGEHHRHFFSNLFFHKTTHRRPHQHKEHTTSQINTHSSFSDHSQYL